MKHLGLLTLLFVFCLSLSGQQNSGRRGSVDFSQFQAVVERGGSIPAAIEQAPENGTEPFRILVKKGLYHQKVIIDRPNIVLVGELRDSCIIVGAEAEQTTMISEYRGQKVHHLMP